MQNRTYKVLFKEEPEGGYTVIVPTLQGCITYGETLEIARHNAEEAIELYIESLQADDLPVPSDENTIEMNMQISHG